MSGFKALHDASTKFGSELNVQSEKLFCAKVDENFEDIVTKKHEYLSLITSKLRLVQAKTLAALPEIKETNKDSTTILTDYAKSVSAKVIEQRLVKILTQNDAVRELVTTPDMYLNPEQIDRKSTIITQAVAFSEKELTLTSLKSILEEDEAELLEARKEWDMIKGKLRSNHNVSKSEEQAVGPLHKRLQTLVDKMELMRWLISKLVIAKAEEYDWTMDLHRRVKVLALTRQCHTVHSFTDA